MNIENSLFKNNKVFLFPNLDLSLKGKNYVLSQGGAIYFEPYLA